MQCTSVFDKNLDCYDKRIPLIVNQGGTRSSKTYSILQLLFLIALKSKTKKIISICSYALPHLKLGAMRDFESIIESCGYLASQFKNISDSTFYINNSIVEFFGTENLGKVHGPARDILFINECNFIKEKIYEQLAIRTRGTIFLDFNPTCEFWYHSNIQGKINHELIKSTYLDNEFLTEAQIERIESKKINVIWWRVYGLGELGRLEGAILQNWEFGKFDDLLSYGFGLDFGSRDPDSLIKIAIDKNNKKIFVEEKIYQNGLSTQQLGTLIKNSVPNDKLIIADSAATRTIQDLSLMGINIKPVKKNKITDDIKLLQEYQIIVEENSFNISRELNTWVWLDKRGEIPLDDNNHTIDPIRYYCQTILRKPNINIIQSRRT